MKVRVALMVVLALCGCSRQAVELPTCTSPLDASVLSESMRVALANAELRVAAECAAPGIQCQYGVRRGDPEKIYVKVDYRNADVSGRCGRAPGMCATFTYDDRGNFVESGLCI
jgi:hypothetical protein